MSFRYALVASPDGLSGEVLQKVPFFRRRFLRVFREFGARCLPDSRMAPASRRVPL